MRERVYGSMSRVVAIPADVKESDSTATFKNGVLEIRLKKAKTPQKTRIQIE
jgi:HSP20 family protein